MKESTKKVLYWVAGIIVGIYMWITEPDATMALISAAAVAGAFYLWTMRDLEKIRVEELEKELEEAKKPKALKTKKAPKKAPTKKVDIEAARKVMEAWS